VHESNALPGIANKLGARFTTHVATSFPESDLRHATYVGLPIRRMISTLDRAARRAEALRALLLDPGAGTWRACAGNPGADACAAGLACGLLAEAGECLPSAPISGREAVEWIRRVPGSPGVEP
jgi:UDP-N-acetylglucosamine--N-acetylmuramyl-(pentapeptide) pyrophosphoryl-undecaprenol N-acetylglucosamine transferase